MVFLAKPEILLWFQRPSWLSKIPSSCGLYFFFRLRVRIEKYGLFDNSDGFIFLRLPTLEFQY